MIEEYKSKDNISLVDFFRQYKNYNYNIADFYITKNNIRYFGNEEKNIKNILKELKKIYVRYNNGNLSGIIGIWSSIGNNIARNFIKLAAKDEKTATDLLTILLWSQKTDLYIKLKNNSPFIKIFNEKGFFFRGVRDKEILLMKIYVKKIISSRNYDEYKNDDD